MSLQSHITNKLPWYKADTWNSREKEKTIWVLQTKYKQAVRHYKISMFKIVNVIKRKTRKYERKVN